MSDVAPALRRISQTPLKLRLGAITALVLLLVGFFSIVWTPFPVDGFNVGSAMLDPGGAHWLGTDQLGRDVVSLLMRGLLTSFVVAAVGVGVGAAIGLAAGAVWGGLDQGGSLSARAADYPAALLAIVVTIVLAALAGPGPLNVMVAIAIVNIPVFAMLARNAVVDLRDRDHVAAARLAGMGAIEIGRRHVLPALAVPVAALAVTQMGTGVMAEAALSYVGLGTQPPATSLGLMLRDAQASALLKPLLAVVPGLAIIAIVLALNLAAEGLRERAPKQGGDRGAA